MIWRERSSGYENEKTFFGGVVACDVYRNMRTGKNIRRQRF